MCSDTIVSVRDLSKVYEIYGRPVDRLKQFLVRGRRRYFREFWALKNVSFEVARGEVFGIIGRNGSGKSTLLQIICGTLPGTYGDVRVNGRIAALLELGAGFNPEFSGRENIYLYGALVGLSRRQVEERFDDMVSFADIGDYIEQPVKTYSDGMFVRLAFSVAINVDPDVLVVDEALAVGDEAFQRKCYQRIMGIRDNGGTILFVSHSAQAVTELCDRTLLLDAGERLLVSTPETAVARYHKLIFSPADRAGEIRAEIRALDHGEIGDRETPVRADSGELRAPDTSGEPDTTGEAESELAEAGLELESQLEPDGHYDPDLKPKSTVQYVSVGATIADPHLEDVNGNRVNVLVRGRSYVYAYRVDFDRPSQKVRFGMLIKNILGGELGGLVSHRDGDGVESVEGGKSLQVHFAVRCHLAPGTYFTNAGVLGLVDGEEQYLHRIVDACMFHVAPEVDNRVTNWVDFSEGMNIAITQVGPQNDD
jgi:lipopolysaccharide transport system ATP-binding protein